MAAATVLIPTHDHGPTLRYAVMRELLAGLDFTHSLPVWIDRNGKLRVWRVDLRLPGFHELLLGGENRIPLSCGAHTLELYRRLPAGRELQDEARAAHAYGDELAGLLAESEAERERLAAWAVQLEADLRSRRAGS
jgi:hypothetical protein